MSGLRITALLKRFDENSFKSTNYILYYMYDFNFYRIDFYSEC